MKIAAALLPGTHGHCRLICTIWPALGPLVTRAQDPGASLRVLISGGAKATAPRDIRTCRREARIGPTLYRAAKRMVITPWNMPVAPRCNC